MKERASFLPPKDSSQDDRTLRLETALRHSEKLAMAGRWAASVMHEINNPSQAIADLVYLIAKEADRPELVRARAAQLEEQLVRIQYIARQTLSYFRDTPQMQAKDLVPLLEAALRYQSSLVEAKKIQVRKELPDRLITKIFPGDFMQMVSNLIRNALEALPAGGTLCVRLRAHGSTCRLTIADNGCGIPEKIQARMFEAFQTDKAETGNGLGLWICKTIVDKHSGSILWRSATEGKSHGTAFSISLPLSNPLDNDSFSERTSYAS
jgi:signal transduction histidine kinase